MQIEDISKTYSAEIAYVILCCRVFIRTSSEEELEQYVKAHELNWDEVYRLAAFHRVRPIVYKVINNNSNIPAAALLRFRNYCHALSVFAFERQVESRRIQQLLQQQGIFVRLYKGLDFAQMAYAGDISMREFTDMDMMIDARRMPELVGLMTAEGYTCTQGEYIRRFPGDYVTNKKDICFYKRSPMGRLFGFEFHHRPTGYFMDQSIGFKELFGPDYLNSSSPISHEQYYRLMVLHHGASDYYPNLRSLVDLVMLSQNRVLDVLPGLRRYERLGQELATRLLGCPAARMPTDRAMIKCADLIAKWQLTGTPRCYRERIYMHIRFSASISGRLRLMLRSLQYFSLPNERDINNIQLPYFKVYYLAKLLRLLGFRKAFN
ncbi:nucleotidyltransferase family protein [Chitinophaga sancti]|uniref:Nucleotidyltransferase family protein n=1 Tax=Chitinophaga sancti TaxID=1004 RepID=A0A1K1M7F0_9BACT|nr:nucleotidyltransferase family protein [Chitinophaga sancti]WQD64582.1 nucleotidyltransferase family protein [Chitinophaga sancti]WQG89794.1 nucleotidyltransferase family protein [Chitinophaga sancti]SFW19035.1 Uncharacterised nucleotidyltransferase [Chitinophaga sancti]